MVSWVNWLFHKGNNFIRQRTTANSHLTLKAQPITSRKPSCSRACMNVSTSKANDQKDDSFPSLLLSSDCLRNSLELLKDDICAGKSTIQNSFSR